MRSMVDRRGVEFAVFQAVLLDHPYVDLFSPVCAIVGLSSY